MSKRKMVAERLELMGRYDSYSFKDFEKVYIRGIDRANVEFKGIDGGTFMIECDEESEMYSDRSYPKVYLTFMREETDKEVANRLEQEGESQRMRDERDRLEFERLSRKFAK